MDIYKLKFTRLQNEILRFLFIKSGKSFNLRRIALSLNVSLTAVSKALKQLVEGDWVIVKKDPESKRLSITLNKENPVIFPLKRVENFKLLFESGLVQYLSETFPGATLVLFGSYAFGEDTINSDIDIAIIGSKEKNLDMSKFEGLLERRIVLNFYGDLNKINKNLKANILNGITLEGAVEI